MSVDFFVKSMRILPSGNIYMLCKQGKSWTVRSIDGVEFAKRPFIIRNRLETGKSGIVSREEAFNRLMHIGVLKDEYGFWEIAGLGVFNEELFEKSIPVLSKTNLRKAKNVFNKLTSVKVSPNLGNGVALWMHFSGDGDPDDNEQESELLNFGSGTLFIHFLGEGELDKHNGPHIHFMGKGVDDVYIPLSDDYEQDGEFPIDYKKEVETCIELNRDFFKFGWDILTGQNLFPEAYSGTIIEKDTNEIKNKKDVFKERLFEYNPNLRI